MTSARRRALGAVAAVLIAAAGLAFAMRAPVADPVEPRAATERPPLMLLTSLPLLFGESFGLDGGSPALAALETRYRVTPISVTDATSLKGAQLLLLAQPRAQPAEMLVDLDRWVRAGGRVLLLADPVLEWPSERPLGDALRPAPMFADTGLLGHWGLRLDAPDRRGPAERTLRGVRVATSSPGALFGKACAISTDRLVADCRLGKGRAVIVADADFINAAAGSANLDGLLAMLARLE